MGVSIGQGFQSMLGVGNSLTRANNAISKENASSANSLRLYQNAATASEDNLARFTQSVNNQKVLDAGGKTLNANTVNFLRGNDTQQTQTFAGQIDNAQQEGHQRAIQAASGVGGNVTDMVNSATALRASIAKATADQYARGQQQNYSQEQANVMSHMVGSLDNSVILDSLDYNKSVATQSPELKWFARTLQGFFPANSDALSNVGKSISDYSVDAYKKWRSGYTSGGSAASNSPDNVDAGGGWNPGSGGGATFNYAPSQGVSFDYNYDEGEHL